MYLRMVRGVIVDAANRTLLDGPGWTIITLLTDEDKILTVWVPEDREGYEKTEDVYDVESYSDRDAVTVKMSLREWEGKTKRKAVAIGD